MPIKILIKTPIKRYPNIVFFSSDTTESSISFTFLWFDFHVASNKSPIIGIHPIINSRATLVNIRTIAALNSRAIEPLIKALGKNIDAVVAGVVDKLIDAGHDVTVFDIMKPHRDDLTHKNIDITNLTNTIVALTGDYEAIYLLAAMADVNDCYKNPVATVEVNVLGVANVLEACVKNEIGRLVFASTVWTYPPSNGSCANIIGEFVF